jgi:hypothetical protein
MANEIEKLILRNQPNIRRKTVGQRTAGLRKLKIADERLGMGRLPPGSFRS